MRKIMIGLMVFGILPMVADAASASGRNGRRVMRSATQMGNSAPVVIAESVAQGRDVVANTGADVSSVPSVPVNPIVEPVVPDNVMAAVVPVKDDRKEERDRCLSRNSGVGTTFVWASRGSDLSNYARMVEDVDFPENNACFVKIDMYSADRDVDLSDVSGKYFEVGQTVKCGSWANEENLKNRILKATKKARIWGTVGATVGGVGLGVGAMELFGNKLIGGKVQGQKALEGKELLRSQILVLKKSDEAEYNKIIKALDDLESVCDDDDLWSGAEKPQDCRAADNPFIGLKETLGKK